MDSLRRYLEEFRTIDGASAAVIVAATTATMLGVSYLLSRPKPIKHIVDMTNQSIEMEDGSRASHLVPKGTFQGSLYDDVSTLHECFTRGVRLSENGPCLGTIKPDRSGFDWMTYKEVYNQAQQLGSAFMQLGLESHPAQDPKPENIIGIFSQNRTEWVIAEQAANMFSLVVVALYDNLGLESCQYSVNQTEMKIVVCDTGAKVDIILSFVENTPSFKQLVVMDIDTVTEEQKAKAEQFGVKIDSFKNTLVLGSGNICNPNPPTPDEVATIGYTSGTTGNPKGVMLTHANLVNSVCGIIKTVDSTKVLVLDPKVDAHLSYLPLANQFERSLQRYMFMHGVKIGFFSGDVRRLIDDMQMLRPTIFPTVPRLLNGLCDKIKAGVHGSWIKTTMLKMALRSKASELKKGIIRNDSIWDRLIFSKVQNSLGGRVRLVLVGLTPMTAEVLAFSRAAFGCPVLKGYGQAETIAVCLSLPSETQSKSDHLGPPLPNCVVKLIDVPEINYLVANHKGEVCVKGNNVMLGYFKEPAKTAEAIDKDGWLHTGDIGEWTKEGTLNVIDRKKHIFKLAQGEFVAPEIIENVYERSALVAQVFVDGNSLRAFVVAVVVPDVDGLTQIATNNGISGSMADLCQNGKIKQLIFDDMLKEGKQAGLEAFEQVKDICLYPEMFSMENSLLTPTFKLKRPQARQFFKQMIDAMYEKRSD